MDAPNGDVFVNDDLSYCDIKLEIKNEIEDMKYLLGSIKTEVGILFEHDTDGSYFSPADKEDPLNIESSNISLPMASLDIPSVKLEQFDTELEKMECGVEAVDERPSQFTNKVKRRKNCGVCLKNDYIHAGGKKFTCKFCQKSFSVNSKLTEHLSIHTSERKFVCNICQKSSTHSSSLKKHLSIHIGEKNSHVNFVENLLYIVLI
ncbi:uncharacterized protein LOC142318890 [Lycorma delicatula]|uniref:uncharacterized protein LOC142318890 n=1 Tax=Lycorma delicatula TaxID=130591 RepID=UPI003F510225